MVSLPDDIIQPLHEYHKNQEKLLSYYKEKEVLEMMYLVKWSFLERVIKDIASEYRKMILKAALHEWLLWAEKGVKRPTKEPRFNIFSDSLPQESDFISALNYYGFEAECIWDVMKSTGAHRKYRNELAHTGKRISTAMFSKLYPDLETITNKILNNSSFS